MYRIDTDDKQERPAVSSNGIHRPTRRYLAMKRALDLIGATSFFLLFLPMFVVVAVGVAMSSPGPIFYSQSRLGRGGRHFEFYKFRSMKVNSDELLSSFLDSDAAAKRKWEEYQKVDNDPRITTFGHFIRRTSLDELPQFWNVLKGDMSLVGPRPCMPDQKRFYGDAWHDYCTLRPGITGLWQISGRNTLTYEQRVTLDVMYVRRFSLRTDVEILLKTIAVVMRGYGAR